MIRGTTPTLEFTLPFGTELLAGAYVTLSQNGKVIIDKPLEECECNANKLSVKLTQAETLLLDCGCNTEIQVRAKMNSGDAVASRIVTVRTERILKDGEI